MRRAASVTTAPPIRALEDAGPRASLSCLIADRAWDGDAFRARRAPRHRGAVIAARRRRRTPSRATQNSTRRATPRNAASVGSRGGRRVATGYDQDAPCCLGLRGFNGTDLFTVAGAHPSLLQLRLALLRPSQYAALDAKRPCAVYDLQRSYINYELITALLSMKMRCSLFRKYKRTTTPLKRQITGTRAPLRGEPGIIPLPSCR